MSQLYNSKNHVSVDYRFPLQVVSKTPASEVRFVDFGCEVAGKT